MRTFACCLGVLLIAWPGRQSRAEDALWMVPDAPYRATIILKDPAKIADAGIAIQLPEFGQTRADLGDMLLVNAKGQTQPLAAVWRGEGQSAILLAKELKAGELYYVYFGGGAMRSMLKWEPKISLLMETRRLPENAKFDSWPDMQKTWAAASVVDGAGFVGSIYQGGNPFGESMNFTTHYTGWLQTSGTGELMLYTLSSDGSFVLVNDRFEFGWPGVHSPRADAGTVHSKKVTGSPGFTKIDYYHAKFGGDEAATVLGWQRNGKLEAIPPSAWLHPGEAQLQKIEQSHGWPLPMVKVQPDSYLGYSGRWLTEARFTLANVIPDGWSAEWRFDDGSIVAGAECRRILAGAGARSVVVKLRRASDEVQGVKNFRFPDDLRAALIKNPNDIARYLDLLAHEKPEQLSKAALEDDLVFLRDFGTDGQIAQFAGPWLGKNPGLDDPMWLAMQLAQLRDMAQTNPSQAMAVLGKIDPKARARYAREFNTLELDILVFGLRDPSVEDRAKRLAFENPNSDMERLAKVRVGDLFRLTDRYPQAVSQYQSIQKTIVDETAGRKLPAQDQAYSITIRSLINRDRRREALDRLREWELKHPMAKFDSDFLLLRGRTLIVFGRWNEALAELDSFKKIEPDSPYVIDTDFYRAVALDGLGRKDEARKIWSEIATKYPKHELASQSKTLAAKP